ncbi:hypothetical protein IWQ61_006806 [Dispira simplex]|nr:hypothetical protein IWQ61_006806 [Dispira simplex]
MGQETTPNPNGMRFDDRSGGAQTGRMSYYAMQINRDDNPIPPTMPTVAPAGRSSYYASLGQGVSPQPASSAYPSPEMAHMYPPPGMYVMPYAAYPGPPHPYGAYPNDPSQQPHQTPAEDSATESELLENKDNRSQDNLKQKAESGVATTAGDSNDPLDESPKPKKKKQGLRRLMCFAPKVCVGVTFGVLLALFLILFFAIPRTPNINISMLEVTGGPYVTYEREKLDFGLDIRANVTMMAKSGNFYPLTITKITLEGYDADSSIKIGNGTVKNFYVRPQTTSYHNGTFSLSYHSSDQDNKILSRLYSRCTPSYPNNALNTGKVGNIQIRMLADIEIASIKWLGIHPKIAVNTELVCPDE